MGNSVSFQISLGPCYCCLYKHYVVDLQKNIRSLKVEVDKVESMRDSVLKKINLEESRGHQRLPWVQRWVTEVGTVTQKAYDVLEDAQGGRKMLCSCMSFQSTYKYGKKVSRLLYYVERLISTEFEEVTERAIYTPVLPLVLVGQEKTLEKTRQSLMEDGVRVLGLYGIGGVGKTELFSRLYSSISTEAGPPFDSFLWIVVSRSVQIHRIQENIGKVLALYNEEWERKSLYQKAVSIHGSLRRKRFLVVLDDLWKKLDLAEIGIPLPTRENGGKIVIISRSRNVCDDMRADAFIEVQPLEEEMAWDLFRSNLRIYPETLARIIADKCHGLPLALQVAGASMASARSIDAWRRSCDKFNSEPMDDSNREDSLLLMLKACYDAIDYKGLKLCILFCALFPEDQEMRKEELVELWIGEKIIDYDQYTSKRRGDEMIRILLAGHWLIEAGESRDKLKMHNIIREWALSIASHPEKDREDFIRGSYTQVGPLSDIKNWRNVSRVSLVGDDIKTISGHFDCPKLKTLLLRDTKLETISPEVFSTLPALMVLDLSLNKHLNILPDAISKLVSLEYLNLSSTGIKRLPPGLSELHELKYLNLEHTHMLKDITGISDLVSIQVLRLYNSGFNASCDLVEELELLKHLEILTISLQDEDVVQKFLTSPKLVSCTQGFYLKYCAILSSVSISPLSSSLRCLDVQDSFVPEMKVDHINGSDEAITTLIASPSLPFFNNLNEVKLDGCNGLRELTWLLFAPSLTTLLVMQSRDIKEIISKEKAASLSIVPFNSLEFLGLEGLDNLRSIYWDPLPLPRLREIRVRSCPGLTKLPLNSESAKGHNLVISAEKELLQRIKWEDKATQQRLFPSSSLK